MASRNAVLPVNAVVGRFIARLTSLSSAEWDAISASLLKDGLDVSMLDASRNAAVALAVRDLITADQFHDLYKPFVEAIPVDSLVAEAEPD